MGTRGVIDCNVGKSCGERQGKYSSSLLVILCNLFHQLISFFSPSQEKLVVYWPQDRAVKHGPFMVKLDGEVELADYVIRKMTVTKVCFFLKLAKDVSFFYLYRLTGSAS